jgi:Bacterial SH3 domain
MKGRILDPQVKVYNTTEENEPSIATLSEGMEVEFGGPERKAGQMWVPVTLSTGQQAFISGEARIFPIREGALMQESVDVHTEPSAESSVKQSLTRNSKMSILEVKKEGDERWVRIRDSAGSEGFIAGDTRIRLVQQKTKAQGRKNLLSGFMWLVAGGLITFSGTPSLSGSAFALLGYGALFFGAAMIIYGVYQVVTAPI